MAEQMVHTLLELLSGIQMKELIVFIISLIPTIELRGGIIAGYLLGLPWLRNLVVAVIANVIPVPFILFFIKKVLAFMRKHGILVKLVDWIEARGQSKSSEVTKYEVFGLMLFVAIPLPGTGAWTGSLVAALLEMDVKKAMLSVFAGVLVAGFIMTVLSYGLLDFIL
ncbi:MAG: small multi-drug export protein [Erysipelotrichaceae bacterium]|nr:small multi-drug export protein [Erysipelotrichaceae bacterium]